jgi:hypothetical protein
VNAREVKYKVLDARESRVDEAIECSRRNDIDARTLSSRRNAFMAGSSRIAERHVSRGADGRRRRGD